MGAPSITVYLIRHAPIDRAVGGFSILDNHLHVLVRLDPDVVMNWSDEDVVQRWGRLFPPRDSDWVRYETLLAAWRGDWGGADALGAYRG
jgi:hypothetical protein